ncbi:WD repeat-containing protein 59 [Sarcoptes scabiei]|nr:WD repeat-containing protein 59 [Sarcoptes scabiei]
MGLKQSTATSPSRIASSTDDDNATVNSFASPFGSGPRISGPRPIDTSETNDLAVIERDWRQRARSLTAVLTGVGDHLQNRPAGPPSTIIQPSSSSSATTRHSSAINFSSSRAHDDEDFFSFTSPHSLPLQFLQYNFNHFKCLFCSKVINQDDIDCHLLMCITNQLNYNEDILTEDKGECVICLEEMLKGSKIARLPCLCIYHKACIDAWFNVNRSCPEHPID